MHENVVSISHTPVLLLWSFQNNSRNSDKPSTMHPSEIRMQKDQLLTYHQKQKNYNNYILWVFIIQVGQMLKHI